MLHQLPDAPVPSTTARVRQAVEQETAAAERNRFLDVALARFPASRCRGRGRHRLQLVRLSPHAIVQQARLVKKTRGHAGGANPALLKTSRRFAVWLTVTGRGIARIAEMNRTGQTRSLTVALSRAALVHSAGQRRRMHPDRKRVSRTDFTAAAGKISGGAVQRITRNAFNGTPGFLTVIQTGPEFWKRSPNMNLSTQRSARAAEGHGTRWYCSRYWRHFATNRPALLAQIPSAMRELVEPSPAADHPSAAITTGAAHE
jgi:hypothetical protein